MSNTPEACEKAEPKPSPAGPSPSSLRSKNRLMEKSPELPQIASPSSLRAGLPDTDRYPDDIAYASSKGSGVAAWMDRSANSGAAVKGGAAAKITLLDAIRGGASKRVSEILDLMGEKEAAEALATFDLQVLSSLTVQAKFSDLSQRESLIMHACLSGDVDVFDTVLSAMEARLTNEQLRNMLTATGGGSNETLVESAAKGGNQALFEKVVRLRGGEVLETTVNGRRVGGALVRDAALHADVNTFRAVVRILDTQLTKDQAMSVVTGNDEDGTTAILMSTAYDGRSHEIAAWAELLTSMLPWRTVAKACTTAFSAVCRVDAPQRHLEGMSVLIAYGADPTLQDLTHLSDVCTSDQLKDCFLSAFTRVDNPFIPGLTLSIALGEAAETAPVDHKLLLSSLRQQVDELLLEVLERLPQAVRDFTGGFRGCAEVFEPGSKRAPPSDFAGPLQRALKDEHYADTLCTVPIIADYISHKFVSDLPNILTTGSVFNAPSTRKDEQQDNLQRAKLVADGDLGRRMQGHPRAPVGSDAPKDRAHRTEPPVEGCWDMVCSGELLLPGMQFIVVGVISKPYCYYKVPAMRMALDFMVYLGVVTLFNVVVGQDEDGALSKVEIVFTIYITDEILSGIRTMWGENFRQYWQDGWNCLNAVALILLASSNVIRVCDNTETVDVQSLLALSAPLVYVRFLFFAQTMRRQGLVIHTISLMIGELLQFGIVLIVIMMGFTMAFYALYIGDEDYEEMWLDLFKALLGEVSAFDSFTSTTYDNLATFLLVIYLVIMSIMLLNLLIAVLSTAHEKVNENAEREFRASKVRVVRFYHRVVQQGMLPAPMNLVQLAVCLPVKIIDRHCFRGNAYAKTKRAFGGLVFWVVSGPVAIVFGFTLWAVSVPTSMVRVWTAPEYSETSRAFRVGRCCAVVPLHLVGAPLILLGLWLQAAFVGLGQGGTWAHAQVSQLHRKHGNTEGGVVTSDSTEQQHTEDNTVSVREMLKKAPDGRSLPEIWACLDNPLTVISVRQDEADRPPTVQQIQILQTNLETTCKNEIGDLRASLDSSDAAVLARVDGLERKLRTALGVELDSRMRELEHVVSGAVKKRVSKVEEKLDELLKRLE